MITDGGTALILGTAIVAGIAVGMIGGAQRDKDMGCLGACLAFFATLLFVAWLIWG